MAKILQEISVAINDKIVVRTAESETSDVQITNQLES